MQFFDEAGLGQIRQKLSPMREPVAISMFATEKDPKMGEAMEAFLKEVCSANPKLSMDTIVVERDKAKAEAFGVYAVPSFAISGKERRRVLYYGIPSGYELRTFLLDIIDVSTGKPDMPSELARKVSAIKGPLHIQVFVSSTCPYCPQAAKIAHDMAILNPEITADVIDTAQFTPLAQAFRIMSVPTTVINRKVVVTGAIPLDELLKKADEAR